MKRVFLSKLFYIVIAIVFLLLLLYKVVFGTKNADANLYQSDEIDNNVEFTEINSNEETDNETECAEDVEDISESEEELRKRVIESIKEIDFTARIYPINTEIYDSEMDREYKEAFL